jgi:hypothetical protein
VYNVDNQTFVHEDCRPQFATPPEARVEFLYQELPRLIGVACGSGSVRRDESFCGITVHQRRARVMAL